MDTIKPRRIHPIWDIAVFVWIAVISAGIGVMQRKELALWLILICTAVGLCVLTVLCVKFVRAQGQDIFVMTEDSVPKGRICMRFIIECSVVILIAAAAGALIGFLAAPESAPETSATTKNREMSGDFGSMNFGDFSGMPEGMGEGSFTFPQGGDSEEGSGESGFDFPSGSPFGEGTFPGSEGSSENSEGRPEMPAGMTMPEGYSRDEGGSAETSGRPDAQRPQSAEQIQNPYTAETGFQTDNTAAEENNAAYFTTMGLFTVLCILTAAASLAVSVNRYNPYDEWEWKYEYAE